MSERLARAYVTELEGDGRTVFGRCVPYNVPATVRDNAVSPPYTEVFATGAFKRIVEAQDRVLFTYAHPRLREGGGAHDRLGRSVAFEDRMDGLYGGFHVVESMLGDHVLALVRERVITGLSVDFEPQRARRGPRGEVIRTRARLMEVSLTEDPAYEGAEVEMVRTATGYAVDLSEYRPKQNSELDARIARARGVATDEGEREN